MSIAIKSPRELDIMWHAGTIVANTLAEAREALEPGMTTKELDRLIERSIRRQGGIPAFPFINDFPGNACISVNNEVVHGIPGKRRVREGDIVKIDVGAIYDGLHGDAAITVPVGRVSAEASRLVQVTEGALAAAIEICRPDAFLHDIGAVIEDFVGRSGFSIVRQYVGHGIGTALHEPPSVPHFAQQSRGPRLRPGMVLTIEPMINAGTYECETLADGWTVVTADARLSAQFEHTVAIIDGGHEVLTLPERGQAWGVPEGTRNLVQSQ